MGCSLNTNDVWQRLVLLRFVSLSLFVPVLLFALLLAPAVQAASLEVQCAQNNGAACHTIAREAVDHGDMDKAKEFAEKSCSLGNGDGCLILGAMYQAGQGVEKDAKKSLNYYGLACENKTSLACMLMGGIMLEVQDGPAAAQFFKKGCDSDYGDGCSMLGSIYFIGNGVERDYQQALSFARKGCDLKSSLGCHIQAVSYLEGKGVKQDVVKGIKLLRRNCDENSNGDSCAILASYYHQGESLSQDYDMALSLSRKACDLESAAGCLLAAGMYGQGFGGIAIDYEKAAKYARKSCDFGDGAGCNLIAEMYSRGLGVKRNLEMAKQFYEVSCNLKQDKACESLKKLNAKAK